MEEPDPWEVLRGIRIASDNVLASHANRADHTSWEE
jgi:hypothetical protein